MVLLTVGEGGNQEKTHEKAKAYTDDTLAKVLKASGEEKWARETKKRGGPNRK